ncbi:MAG: sulfotransferase [Acidimicrobiales bacterium]
MNNAVRVLYIGGAGRSGSTLLELMLAAEPDVTALGEVVHLWRRGIEQDELCSCREHFSACPFWGEVGARAFSGWDSVDLGRLAKLRSSVDRQRYLPLLAVGKLPPQMARAAAEYSELYSRVYASAHEIAGGLLVDSSKHPSLAYLLARDPAVDLRVCHVVRDSRGVAYSRSRWVRRPEDPASQSFMPRARPLMAALSWLGTNLAFEVLAQRRSIGVPVLRLRYEDLLADPGGSLNKLRSFAGLEERPEVAGFLSGARQPAQVVHSVAGNPMRFSTAPIELRPDEAWRTKMPARDQGLVFALTAPLARRYGYKAGA